MREDLIAFERVLAGLEREIIESSDEEIVAAASDLGMDLELKASAAFLGLLHARPRRIEDIFDVDSLGTGYAGFLKGGKDAD